MTAVPDANMYPVVHSRPPVVFNITVYIEERKGSKCIIRGGVAPGDGKCHPRCRKRDTDAEDEAHHTKFEEWDVGQDLTRKHATQFSLPLRASLEVTTVLNLVELLTYRLQRMFDIVHPPRSGSRGVDIYHLGTSENIFQAPYVPVHVTHQELVLFRGCSESEDTSRPLSLTASSLPPISRSPMRYARQERVASHGGMPNAPCSYHVKEIHSLEHRVTLNPYLNSEDLLSDFFLESAPHDSSFGTSSDNNKAVAPSYVVSPKQDNSSFHPTHVSSRNHSIIPLQVILVADDIGGGHCLPPNTAATRWYPRDNTPASSHSRDDFTTPSYLWDPSSGSKKRSTPERSSSLCPQNTPPKMFPLLVKLPELVAHVHSDEGSRHRLGKEKNVRPPTGSPKVHRSSILTADSDAPSRTSANENKVISPPAAVGAGECTTNKAQRWVNAPTELLVRNELAPSKSRSHTQPAEARPVGSILPREVKGVGMCTRRVLHLPNPQITQGSRIRSAQHGIGVATTKPHTFTGNISKGASVEQKRAGDGVDPVGRTPLSKSSQKEITTVLIRKQPHPPASSPPLLNAKTRPELGAFRQLVPETLMTPIRDEILLCGPAHVSPSKGTHSEVVSRKEATSLTGATSIPLSPGKHLVDTPPTTSSPMRTFNTNNGQALSKSTECSSSETAISNSSRAVESSPSLHKLRSEQRALEKEQEHYEVLQRCVLELCALQWQARHALLELETRDFEELAREQATEHANIIHQMLREQDARMRFHEHARKERLELFTEYGSGVNTLHAAWSMEWNAAWTAHQSEKATWLLVERDRIDERECRECIEWEQERLWYRLVNQWTTGIESIYHDHLQRCIHAEDAQRCALERDETMCTQVLCLSLNHHMVRLCVSEEQEREKYTVLEDQRFTCLLHTFQEQTLRIRLRSEEHWDNAARALSSEEILTREALETMSIRKLKMYYRSFEEGERRITQE